MNGFTCQELQVKKDVVQYVTVILLLIRKKLTVCFATRPKLVKQYIYTIFNLKIWFSTNTSCVFEKALSETGKQDVGSTKCFL